MEAVVMLVGCILSFLCGAYVRQPFSLISIREKDNKAENEDKNKNTLDRQWENFWNYDGSENEDID